MLSLKSTMCSLQISLSLSVFLVLLRMSTCPKMKLKLLDSSIRVCRAFTLVLVVITRLFSINHLSLSLVKAMLENTFLTLLKKFSNRTTKQSLLVMSKFLFRVFPLEILSQILNTNSNSSDSLVWKTISFPIPPTSRYRISSLE